VPGRPPKEPKPICPKCSQPVSYFKKRVIGGKTYIYAVHYKKEFVGNRPTWVAKECYLGREEKVFGLVSPEDLKGVLSTLDKIVANGYKDLARIALEEVKKRIPALEAVASGQVEDG